MRTRAFAPARHPDLADARTRSAPINANWLSGPAAEAMAGFENIDEAAEIEARAAVYLADPNRLEALLTPLIAALAANPWFEPALKVSCDQLRTGVVLLDSPTVTISATITRACELNRLPPPATVVLPGRVRLTRYVRGGKAQMRRWRAEPAGPDFSAATASAAREIASIAIEDGMLIRQDGRVAGHLLARAEHDIVAITATLKASSDPLMREYAVADGALVRAACADDAASRIEMLLTFLRVSARTDAAPLFDTMSRHPAFHLRWAAMREWLMLDARSARARLADMAVYDANAEVRAAAAATLPPLDRRLEHACLA